MGSVLGIDVVCTAENLIELQQLLEQNRLPASLVSGIETIRFELMRLKRIAQ